MKLNWLIIWALFVCMITVSCSVRKFVPEGKFLYDGSELEFENSDGIENFKDLEYILEDLEYPEPNTKILGMRPGLYFYYKSQTDSGWIFNVLNRRMGEEPVYLEDVDIESREELMNNRLENRGHFNNRITNTVETNEKSKTATITYELVIPPYYKLASYILEGDSLRIFDQIQQYLDESNLFKTEDRFDLNKMKLERELIDTYLKNRGYYNLNQNFLEFQADTNQYDGKQFDLYLGLKNDVPTKSKIPYRIAEVRVFPNYTLPRDSSEIDTLLFEDKKYIQEEMYFRPKRLDPLIQVKKGDYYSANRSSGTSRRIGSTSVYKFVNIRYDEIQNPASDTVGQLIANIYLSPLNRRAVRAELQAVTKSNDFAGPSLALTYSNRNLFEGGEILNITANAGYETQFGRKGEPGRNSLQLGLESSLVFPRILLPFRINNNWFDYSIPKTRVRLGGEYVARTKLFSMSSVGAAYGFFWSENQFITHELYPVSITYLNLLKSSAEFEEILDQNTFLQSSFDQQFISGLTYSYIYNGMVDQNKKHQIFLNANYDMAGNLLNLFTGNQQKHPRTFLGLEYAQYAKLVLDLRYHINLGRNQKLATRLIGGYGMPYGNSDVLPYSKQFYAGGPYSIRAFDTRRLGPGTYNPEDPQVDGRSYFDQNGNIRLEANVEYRFPLFSYIFGAVFLDAGNVWLSEANEALPGGEFGSDFLQELGIGTGIGLRVDVQSFVIRADIGVPIHDPSQAANQRWVWEFDRPVINLAIGYPF